MLNQDILKISDGKSWQTGICSLSQTEQTEPSDLQ